MRILFLNQYFPPDPAPTGVLLGEVAQTLRDRGHETCFVSANANYRNAQARGPRILREMRDLVRILAKSLRAPRPDIVISGSSPPALLVAATVVATRHRASSIHWAMDLYPEIAVALGEIPPGFLSNAVARAMATSYRRADRVVALDADMASHLRARYRIESELIRPWVPANVIIPEPFAPPADTQFTWIYSGNLGRAHEWRTLIHAQAELERRNAGIRLVFQGSGPSRTAAQQLAAELALKSCEFRDYTPEDELARTLLESHCTIVTQLPGARGLLWPSKLALLLALPRPILFVGPADGAIARDLRSHPCAGVFAPGQAREVADWLVQLKARADQSVNPAVNARQHRAESLSHWCRLVEGVAASGTAPEVHTSAGS